jgi:glyoxylase-like metal-dependent hydrolase (beta-lactamase superfamily II)
MRARKLAITLAFALLPACGTSDPEGMPIPTDLPLRAGADTASGIRVLAMRTGWVAIKEPHWRFRPPAFLVVPRIFLSGDWHEWLPNIAYAVVTGDDVIVVDTGAALTISDPAYMACDPRNQFFYQRNLRFSVRAEHAVDAQLGQVGIDPGSVATLVITHFHGDHTGRIAAFPRARVLTGRGNWPTHVGAVPCTLPAGFSPQFPRLADGPFGAFAESERLTARGNVRLVPLYGHTPGHVGVLIEDAGRYWLIAGDATFDSQQTRAGEIAGVSQDVAHARATQAVIARQLEHFDTVLLPAHDKSVFSRLPN